MRAFSLVLALLVLGACLPLGGCQTGQSGDLLSPFRGGYTADLEGVCDGTSFAASLTQTPDEQGGYALTLTFYAPEGLSGTVLHKSGRGELSLTAGGVTLTGEACAGFADLLTLFPAEGEVERITLLDGGNTQVSGQGFSLELLASGVPLRIERPRIKATIVQFSAE